MTKGHQCDICKEQITISSDFPELCIVCGNEFLDTVRAMGELTIEMANGYGVELTAEGLSLLPGLSVEEIEIRKELNRLKQIHVA